MRLSRSSLPARHRSTKIGMSRLRSQPPYSEALRVLPSNSSENAFWVQLSSPAPAPTTITSPPRRVIDQAVWMAAALPTTSKT